MLEHLKMGKDMAMGIMLGVEAISIRAISIKGN